MKDCTFTPKINRKSITQSSKKSNKLKQFMEHHKTNHKDKDISRILDTIQLVDIAMDRT